MMNEVLNSVRDGKPLAIGSQIGRTNSAPEVSK
jgi:hypothetical protein